MGVPGPSLATPGGAVDLDGFFGLHPSLAPFKQLWTDGILAPVHAVGSPSNTRSHFDAQDYMESGTPDSKSTRDGWLNRYLATRGTCEDCGGGSGVGGVGSGVGGEVAGSGGASNSRPQTPHQSSQSLFR